MMKENTASVYMKDHTYLNCRERYEHMFDHRKIRAENRREKKPEGESLQQNEEAETKK